jgi:hypothetical protein
MGSTPAEMNENSEACVEHWAARLSFGQDRADIAAEAALGACGVGISEAQVMGRIVDKLDDTAAEQAKRDREAYLKRRAIFRIVQTRSGDCGIPEIGSLPKPRK